MAISPNSLFHFTNKLSSLQGVLTEGFKVYYCREKLHWAAEGGDPFDFHVPMVSFCDIPLSQASAHIDSYGSYGVGLTKKWGGRSKLNPVLYISTDSNLALAYRDAYGAFVLNGPNDLPSMPVENKHVADIIRYMKNYEGPLVRRSGDSIESYRFSDEREWRFVPPSGDCCEMLVGRTYFRENQDAVEKSVAEYRLPFSFDDINYLIVSSDSEISELNRFLRNRYGAECSADSLDRLFSRIVTVEQIRHDF